MTKKIQLLFQISVIRFSQMSLKSPLPSAGFHGKRRKKLFLFIRLSRPPGCICEKESVCGFASHLYEQLGYLPRLFPSIGRGNMNPEQRTLHSKYLHQWVDTWWACVDAYVYTVSAVGEYWSEHQRTAGKKLWWEGKEPRGGVLGRRGRRTAYEWLLYARM